MPLLELDALDVLLLLVLDVLLLLVVVVLLVLDMPPAPPELLEDTFAVPVEEASEAVESALEESVVELEAVAVATALVVAPPAPPSPPGELQPASASKSSEKRVGCRVTEFTRPTLAGTSAAGGKQPQ